MQNETRELNITDLETVSGGMPFYGMGCSLNQQNRIGAIVGALGGIPFVGGMLAGIATGLARLYCS